jgi:hypothetical protein
MIVHGSPAYAKIIVQDRLVCNEDSEFYNVLECHVGRVENYAYALEDQLNLFYRVLGYRTIQARANLSVAEQNPTVRGDFYAVRSIVGMGANSIVERMDSQHRGIPSQQLDAAGVATGAIPAYRSQVGSRSCFHILPQK